MEGKEEASIFVAPHAGARSASSMASIESAEHAAASATVSVKMLTHDAQLMGTWLASLVDPVDLELKNRVSLTDIARLNALARDAEKYLMLTTKKRGTLKRLAARSFQEGAQNSKDRAHHELQDMEQFVAARKGTLEGTSRMGDSKPLHALKYEAETKIAKEWRSVMHVLQILQELPSYAQTRSAKKEVAELSKQAMSNQSIFVAELAR